MLIVIIEKKTSLHLESVFKENRSHEIDIDTSDNKMYIPSVDIEHRIHREMRVKFI